MGVCSERATPTPEGEAGASPHAPDESPEALPPLSLDRGRAGGEGTPQTQHQVHPETPPASPAPLKGGRRRRSPRAGRGLLSRGNRA